MNTLHQRSAVALLIAAAAAVAQQGVLPAERVSEIEALVRTEMARQKIPMVTTAIAWRGRLTWSGAFGYADVENKVRATPDTVHRLGSISKPITAVAALQLYEAGKLDLDAPVQKYVPEFPEKEAPITVRMLLCHQSGIRHYQNRDEVDSTRHYEGIASALGIFAKDPLVAVPGTKFSYTTYGYNLLGAVVERAAGMPFMTYLKERIFVPAGMLTARDDHPYAIIPNRARGYALTDDGELRNCNLADTSNKVPGGGMVSSAADLIRFAVAVRNGELLRPSTLELMWTPQKLSDGKPTEYGLGWFVREASGRKLVLHSGGQQGTSTVVGLLPGDGTAVAVLTNLERAELGPLLQGILQILFR
jgi:CubicO group peptidase (beta-lactamase class C family)